MDIEEIQKKLVSKEASCVEITKEYLKNITSLNEKLNAFITVTSEKALSEAEKIDNEIDESEDLDVLFSLKPLLGVPMAHKDLFSTKDIETTAGSNILRGYIPPYDATAVKRIKDAGTVMLGKLNCDAFAHGTTGENSDFGPALNPYDLSRPAGGSSSGSGVAVSAEMPVFAAGTDTGGSIRTPASFTNVCGLKPTYGRVSRYGIIAMASSLDSIGHLTRTVKDSARVLKVTAGYDPFDSTSSKIKVPDYLESIIGVKGLKIGVPEEYMGDGIDPEVKSAVKNALKVYEKLGAEIASVSLPHTKYAIAVYYVIVPSEVSSNLARYDGIRFGNSRESFGDEAKRRIMIGTYALSAGYYDAYYLKAQKVRTLVIQDFKKAFEKIDILLGPAMPVLPPKLGENSDDPLKNYLLDVLTCPVNLAGLPALSVPAGFSKEGLPIGIQLIGDHFAEDALFRAGYTYEQETRYYEQKPQLPLKGEDPDGI